MDYKMGHIKRNPENGDVAIRTMFDEQLFPDLVWLVASTGSGARNAHSIYIVGWEDIYTPPEDE